MLKKQHRLAKTKDIKLAFQKGRSFFNSFFSIRFVKKTDSLPRFTVVVSTKVSKKATTRNKIKRVARQYIRTNLAGFAGGDYVVTAKNPAAQNENAVVLAKLTELLNIVKSK